MAWNGSGNSDSQNNEAVKNVGRKSNVALRYLIGGGVAIALVAAGWFMLGNDEVGNQSSQLDASVTNALPEAKRPIAIPAETNVNEVVAEKPLPHHVGEMWYREDGQKMITLERKGKIVDMPVQTRKDKTMSKTRIFPHTSENMIANLLRIEPGQGTFGNRTYKGFKEDFLKSLTVPIIPGKDDDEWTRQLKEDVIKAKIELKDALDRGEDIEAIMRETREEYKKLAAVKRQLQAEVAKMIREEGTTIQDVADIKEAANRLLGEKGIAPIKLNPFIEKKLSELNEGVNK